MPVTRLLLVRHGHTAPNTPTPDLTLSGWSDVPLSELGRREADLLARRLRSEPPPDAYYASPLSRARLTAEAIAGRRTVDLLPDLREIGCGELDGLRVEEVRRRHPELWTAHERQDDDAFRWPGGESYREVRARTLHCLRRVARRHPGGRVLLVTHAGPISQLVGWISGTRPACWSRHRPGNASITELLWSPGGVRIVRFDDRAHLR